MFEMSSLASQVPVKDAAQVEDVAGMDMAKPVLHAKLAAVWLQAHHQLPAVRDVEGIGDQVPVPEPVVRALGGQSVALL